MNPAGNSSQGRPFELPFGRRQAHSDSLTKVKAVRSSFTATQLVIRPLLDSKGAWESQGRLMFGYNRPNVSDKYAAPYHEDYLVDALRLTEELIDRIEAAAPGTVSLN